MKNILQQQDKHFQRLIGDWLPAEHLPNGHYVKVSLFIFFILTEKKGEGAIDRWRGEHEFIKCAEPLIPKLISLFFFFLPLLDLICIPDPFPDDNTLISRQMQWNDRAKLFLNILH